MLFSLSEDLAAVRVVASHVFKAGFNQWAGFVDALGNFDPELIAVCLEYLGLKIDVFEGVFDSLVPEDFLDVEDVSGAVVFHCAFPVSEGRETD